EAVAVGRPRARAAQLGEEVEHGQVRPAADQPHPRPADDRLAPLQAQRQGQFEAVAVEPEHGQGPGAHPPHGAGAGGIQVQTGQAHDTSLRPAGTSVSGMGPGTAGARVSTAGAGASRSYSRVTRCSRQYCWQSMTRPSSSRCTAWSRNMSTTLSPRATRVQSKAMLRWPVACLMNWAMASLVSPPKVRLPARPRT